MKDHIADPTHVNSAALLQMTLTAADRLTRIVSSKSCSADNVSVCGAVFTNPKIGIEATVAAVFIGIVPIVLEARNDLTPKDKRDAETGYRPFPFL